MVELHRSGPKEPWSGQIMRGHREANKAVKPEKHLMPTIDDLVADLNGATVFSKLDLSSGHHQLDLEPESRYITTFSTHVGLRRYKRLVFGINAALEIFQNAIEEILTAMPGCNNISDDIIVFRATMAEHDQNLYGVLTTIHAGIARLEQGRTSGFKCRFTGCNDIFMLHKVSREKP